MTQGRPHFVGIGAQKAATTWLFKRLCMHPDIYFPRGKEIHFWDRRDQNDRPIKAYEDIFSGYQIEHIGGKTGEITPAYLLISDKRIRELATLAPDLRILALLRNPVERAVSAAAQVRRTREIQPNTQNPLFSKNTTEAGLYGKHLARWMAHFPAEQFHVLTHEEIKTDPVDVLRRTAAHIGVNPQVYDLIDRSLLATHTSPTPNRIEITPEQKTRLEKTYRSDVNALEKLLDRKFGWLP